MIYFRFGLGSPWAKDKKGEIYSKECYFPLSANKSLELQAAVFPNNYPLLEVNLDARWCGHDHGGIRLDLIAWKFYLSLNLYDRRHWDYDTGTWKRYEPEENLGTKEESHDRTTSSG